MQKRNGFSRGELLAVGVVASVIGTLLVPVLAQTADEERAKQNARDFSCMNNLKQVALGYLQYQQDWDEKMPKATLSKQAGTGPGAWRLAFGWADAIQPYIKNTAVYQCPSEKNKGQDNPMKPGYTDYWLNSNVSGINASNIHSPASLITVGDGDGGASNSTARYNLNKAPKSWYQLANSPLYRHNGKGNYAFADGHVKKCSAEVFAAYHPTLENK